MKMHHKELKEIYNELFKFISKTDELFCDENIVEFLIESESHADFVIQYGVKCHNHSKILFNRLL